MAAEKPGVDEKMVRKGTTYGSRLGGYDNISSGSKRPDGYVNCYYKGKNVLQHRAVWQEHNGLIPKGKEVDHINGIKHDNRIENLQLLDIQPHRIKDCRKIKLRPEEVWSLRECGFGYKEVQALAGTWFNGLSYYTPEWLI